MASKETVVATDKKVKSPAKKEQSDAASKKEKSAAAPKKEGSATSPKSGKKVIKKPKKVVKIIKPGKPGTPRNFQLPGGVWRYSQTGMWRRRAMWRHDMKAITPKVKPKRKPRTIVKPIGGEKNGGTRIVRLFKSRKYYPTEDRQKRRKMNRTWFSKQKRYIRKRITPGTVLILIAGRHRGKRVVFLKQLSTGLLLVTGPFKLNCCPLRRVNQIYVIATSTKIDISKMDIPEHLDDDYFKRKRPQKKSKKDDEIFDTKKEEYAVTEQRKKDQIEVDRQLLGCIKEHPEKNMMIRYLKSCFSLKNKMYPHKLKF